MSQYLRENFPAALEVSQEVRTLKVRSRRRVDNVLRAWDFFLAEHTALEQELPSVMDGVGCMLYRVRGVNQGDYYGGKISVNTFVINELHCLLWGLHDRYGSRLALTLKEVKENVFFKNAIQDLYDFLGDEVNPIHARPIWYCDEERLLQATSLCTAGLMYRALFRLMVQTGGRICDLAIITKDVDVQELVEEDGVREPRR